MTASPVNPATQPRVADAVRQHTGVLLLCALAAAVFWRTAYPTITWWDGSSYPLAAYTMGIASAPGSLLLTLLGWPIAHLPFGSSPAHLLNLFAGLLAAVAVSLVYLIARRLLRMAGQADDNDAPRRWMAFGAAAGALTFAFSDTLWDHATKFTPYILSAVFTGLILSTMLRWWDEAERPDAWRQLALLGLLFGLDFSVHRTNALLLPGALAWILLRHPRTLREPRALAGGAGGLAAGLAVQLLIIPIAAVTRSPLNFWSPSNWPRFWDYVSLQGLGGGFLLAVFPRKSNILSVQTADLVRVLGANFFHWNGSASALGALPAVAAVIGLVSLWRRNRRLATAFGLVLVLQAATTVLYFNIPANFFRSFDRHYLPVCVTIGVLMACGLAAAMEQASALFRTRRGGAVGIAAIVAIVAIVPAAQLIGNWSARDASDRYFTRTYASAALASLPPNAIYITVGDNDTFPVMYLQAVEGVRPDVAILNLSVANLDGYAERRKRLDPSFPVNLTAGERFALTTRPWTDTSLVIPVVGAAEQFGLPVGTALPGSVAFSVRPQYGPQMSLAEATVVDIVRTNQWKRPITFAITAGNSSMAWLEPYARLDGLYWRIVPVPHSPIDVALLRSRLLDKTQYRGYADPSVALDGVTRTMAYQYYDAATTLFAAERARGPIEQCRADLRDFLGLLPPDRVNLPGGDQLASACGPAR